MVAHATTLSLLSLQVSLLPHPVPLPLSDRWDTDLPGGGGLSPGGSTLATLDYDGTVSQIAANANDWVSATWDPRSPEQTPRTGARPRAT